MRKESLAAELQASPPVDRLRLSTPMRVIALLLLLVGVYQIGSGIISALVPIKLAKTGTAPSVIGWVSTAFSVGFLIGCLAAARLIGMLGATRAIFLLVGAGVLSTLMLAATEAPHMWAAARFVAGIAMAALLVLIEAWLATAATGAARATVFGIYMVLSRLAFALGQIALATVDPGSTALLLLAAAAYAAAPWPALTIPGSAPVIGNKSGPDLKDLPLTAPAAAAASFMHGVIGATGPALLPLYALGRGFTVDQTALLLATIPIGGLLFQFPFSYLSDRFGRRTMMSASALATMALSAIYLLPSLPSFPWLLLLTTLWGGAPAALYLLAVAHANDIATDEQRVGWSSTLLFLWGIGAAAGPLAASMLMERAGYDTLFMFIGGLAAALALFLLARKLIRKRTGKRTPAADTIAPAPGPSG